MKIETKVEGGMLSDASPQVASSVQRGEASPQERPKLCNRIWSPTCPQHLEIVGARFQAFVLRK